jgi:short-subunit dehydrogenase
MFAYQGKAALVTGASSGIDATFARERATRGMSVVLVARATERLQSIAGELMSRYLARVEIIAADLADPAAVATVIDEIRRRELAVDLLINNAGFGLHGPLETLSPERERQAIQLNVGALVTLTHAVLAGLLARASGGIVTVASTLAFQPVPYMAVHGATKAFVLAFAHALATEYRGKGVRFLALRPGTTATSFYDVSGGDKVFARMHMRTPEQVVATGLHAFERGRAVAVDGVANRWLFRLTGGVPDGVGARMFARALRP